MTKFWDSTDKYTIDAIVANLSGIYNVTNVVVTNWKKTIEDNTGKEFIHPVTAIIFYTEM